MFKVPEEFRVTKEREPLIGTDETAGNNGCFYAVFRGYHVRMIASDGLGWEHVSVSVNRDRTPTWEVMNAVKDLFWGGEDTVIQYHPKKSEYVNCHPNVLHLWRPIGIELPLPDKLMVGIPDQEDIN